MPDSQDQPVPVPNDRPPVWEAVIADMRARDKLGRERYGTPLHRPNRAGRGPGMVSRGARIGLSSQGFG